MTKRILIDSAKDYFEEDSPLEVPMVVPFMLHTKKELKKRKELKSKDFFIGSLVIDSATGGLAPDMKFTSEQKKIYATHIKK